MQCDQHINNITAKPNKALGFLRSNLKIPSSRIKEQAYQTLVCPLVEYASTVWNPYTKTEINKIEAVQRRAARYIHVNLPAGAFSPDFEGPSAPPVNFQNLPLMKKIKYNKILTYILRSIFLEIPHLELPR